jgi:Arc/MetJ-type ribon-helix-helix transcriptional regulator
MSRVVPTRLPPDLARGIDRLVKTGRYSNRSEVIKEATRLLLSSGEEPTPASMAKTAARLSALLIGWNTPQVETIILYGSTAREEVTPESDVDLLVIIKDGKPWLVRRVLYGLIYPVIASLGVDISLNIQTKNAWLEMIAQGDPLTTSITKEGLTLWPSPLRQN